MQINANMLFSSKCDTQVRKINNRDGKRTIVGFNTLQKVNNELMDFLGFSSQLGLDTLPATCVTLE